MNTGISIETLRNAHKKASESFWKAKRDGDDSLARKRFRQTGVFYQATPEGRYAVAWCDALKDAGLYQDRYGVRVLVSNSLKGEMYGKYCISVNTIKEHLNNQLPTADNVWKAFTDAVGDVANKQWLLKKYQAQFENACDYLYYGCGYKSWLKSCEGCFEREDDANIVWEAAFNKMANADQPTIATAVDVKHWLDTGGRTN